MNLNESKDYWMHGIILKLMFAFSFFYSFLFLSNFKFSKQNSRIRSAEESEEILSQLESAKMKSAELQEKHDDQKKKIKEMTVEKEKVLNNLFIPFIFMVLISQ